MSGQQGGHPGQSGQPPVQTQQGRQLAGFPIKEGAAAGVGAYVAGYVVTYLLLFVSDVIPDEDGFQSVGQAFYNAHFVRIDVGGDATRTILPRLARDSAGGDSLILPALGVTVLVGAVLVAAGYLLVTSISTAGMNTNDAMVAGSALVTGYLPLSFLGVFVFETSVAGTTVAPDIFAGVLLAGLVFPLLLGAVGGYLAVRRRDSA